MEDILPERIDMWQNTLELYAKRIKVKRLTSRWGSCSSDRTLTFSLFMAQLSLELIDYIIVHELTHIKHMNHSKQFWNHIGRFIPDYKALRAELKTHRLELIPKN
jgi:predicted metal-dependent hydrolase